MTKYTFYVDDYIGHGKGFALARTNREAAEKICEVRGLGKIKSWYISGDRPDVDYYKTVFGYEIELKVANG